MMYAQDRVAVPSARKLVLNLAFVAVLFLLVRIGVEYAAALAFTLGTAVQALVVLLALRPKFDFPSLANSARLDESKTVLVAFMFPFSVFAIRQGSRLVENAYASTLAPGSLSALNYAYRIAFAATSIAMFGISVALVNELSKAAAEGDVQKGKAILVTIFRFTLLLALPLTVLFVALPEQVVNLAYGYGAFDGESIQMTASLLSVYGLALTFTMLVPLLSNMFYSFGDTRTPSLNMLLMFGVNVLFMVVLFPFFSIWGLASAFLLTSIVSFVFLTFLVFKRYGSFGKGILSDFPRIFFATFCMYVVIELIVHFSFVPFFSSNFVNSLLALAIPSAMGMVSFYVLLWLLGIKEMRKLMSAAKMMMLEERVR